MYARKTIECLPLVFLLRSLFHTTTLTILAEAPMDLQASVRALAADVEQLKSTQTQSSYENEFPDIDAMDRDHGCLLPLLGIPLGMHIGVYIVLTLGET
jgi:hypothetical protein